MGFVFVRNNNRSLAFFREVNRRISVAVQHGNFSEEQHILREYLKGNMLTQPNETREYGSNSFNV